MAMLLLLLLDVSWSTTACLPLGVKETAAIKKHVETTQGL